MMLARRCDAGRCADGVQGWKPACDTLPASRPTHDGVALTHASARRGAHAYNFNDARVFYLRLYLGQGQIAEAWWRPEDLYAADTFWTWSAGPERGPHRAAW